MGANMVLEVCGLHCGANAAGHFVKMVYDGIEHGIMAAFAEDMSHANVGEQQHAVDAETTPLHNREPYRHDLDLPHIAELWRRGSVIASWAAGPHRGHAGERSCTYERCRQGLR